MLARYMLLLCDAASCQITFNTYFCVPSCLLYTVWHRKNRPLALATACQEVNMYFKRSCGNILRHGRIFVGDFATNLLLSLTAKEC